MTTTPQPPEQPDATPEGAAGAATAGRDPLEVAADLVDDVSRELDPAELASMERLDQPRRLLLVHAHPDDESIGTGATMARYAEARGGGAADRDPRRAGRGHPARAGAPGPRRPRRAPHR